MFQNDNYEHIIYINDLLKRANKLPKINQQGNIQIDNIQKLQEYLQNKLDFRPEDIVRAIRNNITDDKDNFSFYKKDEINNILLC